MIFVRVREDDAFDVCDGKAELVELCGERFHRGVGFRPRVYERQRIVCEQVNVDGANRERRGDHELFNAHSGKDSATLSVCKSRSGCLGSREAANRVARNQ